MNSFETMIKEYAEVEEVSVDTAKEMIISDWGETGLHGYGIFANPDTNNALHIEKIDELAMFDNDIDAAKQAKKDGIKLIPWSEQPKKDDYKFYRFIDTPENREILNREAS